MTERDGYVIPRGVLWVFAYGSLMWDPCFRHDRREPALLRGYHRAFCIYSVRARGTHDDPGLVLGLKRGGACCGIAFRIPAREVNAAIAALWEREMSRHSYVPREAPVVVTGQRVRALTFVANPRHTHYVHELALEEAARRIARRAGENGANSDYLDHTLANLAKLGLTDTRLARLQLRVRELKRG